jgi:hypothetical protein
MIFTCNMNHEGEYDLEYSDISLYQEDYFGKWPK